MGGHGSGPAILVPSRPRGTGAPRQSCSRPLCRGKWSKNKLPLHLFPVKGWTVGRTVTSGPLTSPTCVTGCAKSSYEALSGMTAVTGTEGWIPTQRPLTLGRQKSRQSSRGGAQGRCSPSTPSQGSPGMWQLGFHTHHTMDLWVLQRWKLQEFALGERAGTHRAICEHL